MSTSPPEPVIEVRRSARRRRTVTAYRERGTIVVLIPSRMSKADERRFVEDMVRRVLAREAKSAPPTGDQALLRRAVDLAATYLPPDPLPLHSVSWVSNQNSRWGSCTPANGTIRLSHRLQAMPDWVVDYVLLHELAHLLEANHTPRFWSLVSRYPDADRARGFLEGFLAGRDRPLDE